MRAEQLYKEGQLGAAIEALGAELRDDPLNTKARTFLFELLCFAGEYDRADKQLELLADKSKDARTGGLIYHAALQAERTRRDLFEGKLEERERPKPWPDREPAQLPGTLNGASFATISDADSRIGPQLEVFASFNYLWVPFEHVESIEMQAPRKLRDLCWAPATVRTGPKYQGQDLGVVLIPALAPLTAQHPEEAVQLGRLSVWERDETGEEAPYGPKMLLLDGVETPLIEIRELSFKPTVNPAA